MSIDSFLPPLHPQFHYRVDYVGNEKLPVLVIDNFLHEAEALLGFAVKFGEFRPGVDYYPGVQSRVPGFYSQSLSVYLRDIICNTFKIPPEKINYSQSMYAMVLIPPEQLAIPQSRPHVDSIQGNQLATVHYLCAPDKGGTSLYRHKATGFESLSPSRMDEYSRYLSEEEKDTSWHKQYMHGSNKYYEEIAHYDASFNRLIMYAGEALHSASIPRSFNFSTNPLAGRLTLNTFIYCK